MGNKRIVFAVVLEVSISLAAVAENLAADGKDTIYVGEVQVASSVVEMAQAEKKRALKRVQETLESQLISALSGTRQFKLVTRSRLKDVLEERKLTELGQTDFNDSKAARGMKLTGAKYVLLPRLEAFEDRSEIFRHHQIGRTSVSRKIFLSVMMQIVNTTTGELLPDLPSVQLEKIEEINLVKPGASMESDRALVRLVKDMAGQLAQQAVGTMRPAKVLVVTGRQIMINQGSGAGFHKGGLVKVYAVQKIIDDETGEVFLNEVPIGQAKVIRGDAKKSFAIIQEEDMSIRKGCVVRIIQSASVTAPAVRPPQGEDQFSGSSDKPLVF